MDIFLTASFHDWAIQGKVWADDCRVKVTLGDHCSSLVFTRYNFFPASVIWTDFDHSPHMILLQTSTVGKNRFILLLRLQHQSWLWLIFSLSRFEQSLPITSSRVEPTSCQSAQSSLIFLSFHSFARAWKSWLSFYGFWPTLLFRASQSPDPLLSPVFDLHFFSSLHWLGNLEGNKYLFFSQ